MGVSPPHCQSGAQQTETRVRSLLKDFHNHFTALWLKRSPFVETTVKPLFDLLTAYLLIAAGANQHKYRLEEVCLRVGVGVLGKPIQQPIILLIPKEETEKRTKNATNVEEASTSKSPPKWRTDT